MIQQFFALMNKVSIQSFSTELVRKNEV